MHTLNRSKDVAQVILGYGAPHASWCVSYGGCCFALQGLSLLVEAINKAGYTGKIKIGMDVAASEFYKDGKYDLDFKNPESKEAITSDEVTSS